MAETLTLKFKSAYSPSSSVTLDLSGRSATKQNFKAECDINTIMAKYLKTGLIEHNMSVDGQYGDFLSEHDYHSAMNAVLAADEAFASLPSNIRNRFENDPGAFLDFTQNPDNLPEMAKMGLTVPKTDPEPSVTPAPEPVSAAPEPSVDPS